MTQGNSMIDFGRAYAISRLIGLVGPAKAAELVRSADAAHVAMNPTGCENKLCPVCARKRAADAA